MKKRTFIFTVLLLLLILSVVCIRFLLKTSGSIQADALSNRSKEFLLDQKKPLREKSPALVKGMRYSTRCFSVTFPYVVTSVKDFSDEAHCALRARVISPPAALVIGSYTQPTFLEDTGITLRERDRNVYTPLATSYVKFPIAKSYTDAHGVTVFVHWENTTISIAFSSLQDPSLISESDLHSLVDSIIMTE